MDRTVQPQPAEDRNGGPQSLSAREGRTLQGGAVSDPGLREYFARLNTLHTATQRAETGVVALLKKHGAEQAADGAASQLDPRELAIEQIRCLRETVGELARLLEKPGVTGFEITHATPTLASALTRIEVISTRWPSDITSDSKCMTVRKLCGNALERACSFEATLVRGAVIPGTRFRLGVANSRDQILSLYDWPEYAARLDLMRPGRLAGSGFLGPKEDLVEVLLADRDEMLSLGTDPLRLATPLRALMTHGKLRHAGNRIVSGGVCGSMGNQPSPLPGPITAGNGIFHPKNLTTGFEVRSNVTEMHGDLLALWGFCQGKDTVFTEAIEPEMIDDLRAAFGAAEFAIFEQEVLAPQTFRIEPRDLVRLFW